jgi:hypothetical protein
MTEKARAPRGATFIGALLVVATLLACGDGRAPKRVDSAAGAAVPVSREPSPSLAAVDACAAIAQVVSRLPGAELSQMADSFPAFTGPGRRYGCVLRVEGPASPAAPAPVLATTLPDSLGTGWARDPAIVADGPSETVYGLWRGNVLCLVRVRWSAGRYAGTVACEELRDRVVPRG